MSYAELEAQSAAMAARLMALGVARGDRVGLLLDKSIEAVVSIFAILKAGACYVPLDPKAPAMRNASIISDCAIRVLISSQQKMRKLAGVLPADACLNTLIAIDSTSEPLPGVSQTVAWQSAVSSTNALRNHGPGSPKQPAYILYTSGSTGTPKGVVLSHFAALSFVSWASQTFRPKHTERVISQAPFHFDLSVFDLFVTLGSGATLVLPPPGIQMLPASYAEFISREQINILYATPATLQSLLRFGCLQKHSWTALRWLLFAGDVMPPESLRELMQRLPAAQYANLYGPTETNVCTWFKVQTSPRAAESLPIGKPCAGMEVIVIGSNGIEVSDGEEGELWVRGPQLMSGYWKRPEETATRLLSDPQGGGSWYRTGDRVRRNPAGELLFLGRIDNMLKINGYRIEPEEIERCLRKQPQVEEVVVFPFVPENAGLLLVAAVVASTPLPSTRDLQKYCARMLPKYMIPQQVLLVAELPKTTTGKLDRRRIQAEYAQEKLP